MKTISFIPTLYRKNWAFTLLLLLGIIVCYSPSIGAGFIWDDDAYVTKNDLLTSPWGLWRIWFSFDSPSQYFPLTYTTFYFEHLLWGFNPLFYHIDNIILHAANALLLWLLLDRLKIRCAWLIAAVFALHPIQVESVAWVTERKNVLMGFFFLLSLLEWDCFLDLKIPNWKIYGISLACALLSLWAKTTACTLPAALLLMIWLKNLKVKRIHWLLVSPYVAVSLLMGLVTVWWEKYHQGTEGVDFQFPILQRILVACHAIWFYAGKIMVPANLTFSYPKWNLNPATPQDYIWVGLVLSTITVILLARRKLPKAGLCGLVFFVVTLGPMLGFFALYTFLYTFVADHYQYLACIGLIAVLIGASDFCLSYFASVPHWFKSAAAGAVLVGLGALTWKQCLDYKGPETLWRATIARNPSSWMAHGNLGSYFAEQGRLKEAVEEFTHALQLKPDREEHMCNLGLAYSKLGDSYAAETNFLKAIRTNPNDFAAHQFLADNYVAQGRISLAIDEYTRTITLNPKDGVAYNNLGNCYLGNGSLKLAAAAYENAISFKPNFPEAENNLGACLQKLGKFNEAAEHYRNAVELNSNYVDAYSNLGRLFLREGRFAESIAAFRSALALRSDDADIKSNLAWLLATSPQEGLRNGSEAAELAQEALAQIGQSNAMAFHILAASMAEMGRFEEAVRAIDKAIALAQSDSQTNALLHFKEERTRFENRLPLH